MSPALGIDPFRPAERDARIEVVQLSGGMAALYVCGDEAKADTVLRIARREADRERQALAERRRPKRSRQQARPGRRGGAA